MIDVQNEPKDCTVSTPLDDRRAIAAINKTVPMRPVIPAVQAVHCPTEGLHLAQHPSVVGLGASVQQNFRDLKK